MKVHVDI